MPGAGPQSHAASGRGSSKRGTLSRWHHEWGSPRLAIMSGPAPSTPNSVGGQRLHPSMRGRFPPQKGNHYVHSEVPTGILTQASCPPPPRP